MIDSTQLLSQNWSDYSPEHPIPQKPTDLISLFRRTRTTPALIGIIAGVALFSLGALVDQEAHLRYAVALMTTMVAIYIWPALTHARFKEGLFIGLPVLLMAPLAMQHAIWLILGFALLATWNIILASCHQRHVFYPQKFYQGMTAMNITFMVLTAGILI